MRLDDWLSTHQQRSGFHQRPGIQVRSARLCWFELEVLSLMLLSWVKLMLMIYKFAGSGKLRPERVKWAE